MREKEAMKRGNRTVVFSLIAVFSLINSMFGMFQEVKAAVDDKKGVLTSDRPANLSGFVNLASFEAYRDGRNVRLKWTTDAEANNLGFNIYREADGVREPVNPALIAGSLLRTNANLEANGGVYGWVDTKPVADAIYYLESVGLDGNTNLYGPVVPVVPDFENLPDRFDRKSKLITDLANSSNYSSEREYFPTKNYDGETFADPEGRGTTIEARQHLLAGTSGVKITVNHDAWYQVSTAQLQAAGFDINSNRAYWQVFNNGEEVPIKVNSNGTIEFFGYGTDTVSTDREVYYLIKGQNQGLRIKETTGGSANGNGATSFNVTVQRKDRTIYASSILNGEAENWFGAIIMKTSQTHQDLTVNNLNASGQATLKVKIQGLTAGQHAVNVIFNGANLGAVNFIDQENKQFSFTIPASSVISGVNRVSLQSFGEGADINLVDSINLTYPRNYVAVNDRLRFKIPVGQTVRVSGFSGQDISVYEIINNRVDKKLTTTSEVVNGTNGFSLASATYERELLAVTSPQFEQVMSIEPNIPSFWNESANKANFVIIAPKGLYNYAEQLAQRRRLQNIITRVVLLEDIADEFGFGAATPEAIKKFLQNATTKWRVKPQYALLFGDSSYDVRGYQSQPSTNLIPTKLLDMDFEESASDGWLADFDNDDVENISIGRLPVSNEAEAVVMLNKIARYDAQASRVQKTSLLLTDSGFEYYTDGIQSTLPSGVSVTRYDRYLMGDAAMRTAMISQMNAGPMIMNYTGHGSNALWVTSGFFNSTDAMNLVNSNLSVYFLMSCLNGYSHNPGANSLAEAMLKNPNGGGIVVWASSAVTFADGQGEMSKQANRLAFNSVGTQTRIGDVLRQAKAYGTDFGTRRSWQIFGDPTTPVK